MRERGSKLDTVDTKNRECPACKETGHDSKGDHLYLMRDQNRWACHRKEYHKSGEPYYEEITRPDKLASIFKKHNERPTSSMSVGTATRPSTRDLIENYRGIRKDVYKKYQVEGEYKPDLKALVHPLYDTGGKVVAHKIRKLPKHFYAVPSTKGIKVQLFGQCIFPRAKRLLITEGELDAMAAYQMLEKYKVACVSLPNGANLDAVKNNKEYFRGFKEIVVCLDQDDAGKKVSRDMALLLPHAKFMTISEKDANEMLQKGKQSEFISAFFDAEIFRPPDMIVKVSDVIDQVLLKPTMGVPWPWDSLNKATYGRHPGQGIYVGAGVKIGKSEFINEVIAWDVKHGRKIAVLKFEEPPPMTVKRVAGKLDGIFYHKPGVVYLDADLRATSLSMEKYLLMYPAFKQATWSLVREFITYAAMSGYETIIIDPLTKLTNQLDSSGTESELRSLSDDIACMSQDMGFFYIITCHLKAPSTGPPHERGGKVHSNQFRGSRAMMENTYYLMGIERNKDPELPDDQRNTSYFVLLEDRNFGNVCRFPVIYSPVDQSYREPIITSF